jgi:VWFA-related protein
MATAWLYGKQPTEAIKEEAKQENAVKGNYAIKVAVEEVRLDAVVLDSNWKPITDLTADDFEIIQDKVPQKVLSSVYLTNQETKDAGSWLPGSKRVRKAPQIPSVLDRNNVNRIMVFVVDDFSMSFEQLYFARMGLQRFVERQMKPGDMVAILRTICGSSAISMFSSDKRDLEAKIDNLRQYANSDQYAEIFDRQLQMLRYGIGALRDMPGRKAIMLISAQPNIKKEIYRSVAAMFAGKDIDYLGMYSTALNRLADEALRAKVVVHTMDIHGLETPNLDHIDAEQLENMEPSQRSSQPFRDLDDRNLDALNPIMVKTGGVLIQNNNFFVDGIGEKINNIMNGYYLLSYAPPFGTFEKGSKDVYHKVKVRVMRKGATVYARDGFLSRTETVAAPRYANPLQEAIFSPFLNKDLKVNMASGFLDDAQAGYVLRSWLHVDARDLTITENPGEGFFVKLETMCLTSDINGGVNDARKLTYDFKIREENLSWIREHGIRFSLLLPIKMPGAYYVHAAIRDLNSGKIGSAYQFVQIPNLKRKLLALSNIFVVSQKEDVEWIRTGKAGDLNKTMFEPVLKRGERYSPALRQYASGKNLNFMAVAYNSKHNKEKPPMLEVQSVLYKDGAEIYKSEFKPLELGGVTNYGRIPITQKLNLDSALSNGTYVLELLVRDQNRREKDGLLSQVLDFQVMPEGLISDGGTSQ